MIISPIKSSEFYLRSRKGNLRQGTSDLRIAFDLSCMSFLRDIEADFRSILSVCLEHLCGLLG
jgi:hypothetical protein